MQTLAVPDASGSPYWDNILQNLQLKTCAANLLLNMGSILYDHMSTLAGYPVQ